LRFYVLASIVLIILPTAHICPAQTGLDSSGREHLLTDPFSIVTKVSDIPEPVLTRFREMAKIVREDETLLAEPGAAFQVAAVVGSRPLPWRRLVFAGLSKEYCFIHYERGGRGLGRYVILFRISKEGATFEWGAASPALFKDLGKLREALTANQLHEAMPRTW
jgi:hypothetical protein